MTNPEYERIIAELKADSRSQALRNDPDRIAHDLRALRAQAALRRARRLVYEDWQSVEEIGGPSKPEDIRNQLRELCNHEDMTVRRYVRDCILPERTTVFQRLFERELRRWGAFVPPFPLDEGSIAIALMEALRKTPMRSDVCVFKSQKGADFCFRHQRFSDVGDAFFAIQGYAFGPETDTTLMLTCKPLGGDEDNLFRIVERKPEAIAATISPLLMDWIEPIEERIEAKIKELIDQQDANLRRRLGSD